MRHNDAQFFEDHSPTVLKELLGSIIDYGNQGLLNSHEPLSGQYWKALDLTHVALHLCGYTVWDSSSDTGGSSITPNRSLAETYMMARGSLTVAAVEENLGITMGNFPSTKLLVSLNKRSSMDLVPAQHPGNEGQAELIAKSMRFSDFDARSQEFMKQIFTLSADFDTEFVKVGYNNE